MVYEYLKEAMQEFLGSTLMDDSECITYKELLMKAECLGTTLTHHKYGILCRSELYAAIALLACFYAKKTAVMLSFRYGEKHNRKIIKTMQLSHLITEEGVSVISKPEKESEDLSDVALIMGTSGTTGSPKGAMLTHENILTNLKAIQSYFPMKATDRILIGRPLYHCAVLMGEFLIALTRGTDILFLNTDFHPVTLLKAIRKYQITVFCATPTILYYLCSIIRKKGDMLSVKIIAVSGECMTEQVAKRLRKGFPLAEIYHVYGLTEAGPRVSFLLPELFDQNPLSVGQPLRSVQVKIENGELLVRGRSIMKGYYQNPELTEKVLKDGWLHTGDMAEIDASGCITIKSRRDNLIIRGGMNIYPQEIENALKQEEEIADVLVFGVKDETVGEKIYLKAVTNTLSKSQIFTCCRNLLPSYQLPDFIEIVEEIPRNASGKVLRGLQKR